MVKNCFFSSSSTPALGAIQPHIQWVPGILFPGIKQQRHEADYSSPTSAEFKKMWIYTSTPLYASMVKCLISEAICEAIGTATTPGLLCQPGVIVKMIGEKQMECRLAGETIVLGENLS
jgi:hypothetical protein